MIRFEMNEALADWDFFSAAMNGISEESFEMNEALADWDVF